MRGKFISYSPIRAGNNFTESATNFMRVLLHNLREINPMVKEQNLIEGAGLISFEVITDERKKIKVFMTSGAITILKEELEDGKWFEKTNLGLTNEEFDQINHQNLLN